MKTLRLVLGDQLSHTVSGLRGAQPDDVALMVEVKAEATYVKHHKQKIAFLFSAMRHFADELKPRMAVDYVYLDDPNNTHNFIGEIKRALQRHNVERVVVTEPGEWRVLEAFQTLQQELEIPFDILPDDRFLCSIPEFKDWAQGRKTLRMEFFYREMRKKTGYLMEQGAPIGGQWNFDAKNREPYKGSPPIPKRPVFEANDISKNVILLVNRYFQGHFGDLEHILYPVTREQALQTLSFFIEKCLPHFGQFQDAMVENEPFMFHSLISAALNCGLLHPAEVCDAAHEAYQNGTAPIEAVEGFIRQIIGWREYVRGIYWLKMPRYAQENFFDATRPLPGFFWTGKTEMNCLHQAITQTKKYAYAHHINRLMVTGNFSLLCGFSVQEVCDWYLLVYADAYEWVELPNTLGMALFADGGDLASKPYAASGQYIHKMSNYCRNCRYDVRQKEGPEACPFNYLYWDFMARNEDKLKNNPRLAMPYRTFAKFSDEKKAQIKRDSEQFLSSLK